MSASSDLINNIENLADLASPNPVQTDTVLNGGVSPNMKLVRDLSLCPVWVNPEHRVKTALILMKGHGLSGLGVLKGDRYLGVLNIEDLVGVGEDQPIAGLVRDDLASVTPDAPLRQVAELMLRLDLPRIPVVHEGKFFGIVSAQSLLSEIGRNHDPLTQLPWSDALRVWGVQNLEASREVTIIFFDLDDFGQFNKRHGHLIGDRILREVAEVLKSGIELGTDQLVRYGGDEFAIGTTRRREEAEMMATWLQSKVKALTVEGTSVPISISVGLFGGRRTRERDNTHYGATLDNLINIASQNCMANKAGAMDAIISDEPVSKEELLPRLISASSSMAEGQYVGVAVLGMGSKVISGTAADARSPLYAVAVATWEAMKQLGFGHEYLVGEALEARSEEARVVTVIVRKKDDSFASVQAVTSTSEIATAEGVISLIVEL